jgi:hypothetical protein
MSEVLATVPLAWARSSSVLPSGAVAGLRRMVLSTLPSFPGIFQDNEVMRWGLEKEAN